MNHTVKTVDEFIAVSPEVSRGHLQKLREVIGAAIPEANEQIGYGKPYYKYHGWVTGFDCYTKHISLEIWDGLTADERKELEGRGYETGSKTFKIAYDQKVPADIIAKLVKAQAKRNEAKAIEKATNK